MANHCCSLTLIIVSSIVLLLALFMTFGGFGLVLQLGLPIGLKLLPVNEELMAWISIPLAISIRAKIIEVNAISAENGTVGGGEIVVELHMSQWEEEEPEYGEEPPPKLAEFIHIQETAEIDEIQYYKAILSERTVNHWNTFSWFLVMVGIFVIGGATTWKTLSKKTSKQIMDK